jgi:hypothetical protein
LLQTEISN